MEYPHHLLLKRESGGTADGMGGSLPGTEATQTVYDREADVQEQGRIHFQEDGQVKEGDARAFLPASTSGLQPGDSGAVTWEDGSKQDVAVKKVIRLDDSIVLAYA